MNERDDLLDFLHALLEETEDEQIETVDDVDKEEGSFRVTFNGQLLEIRIEEL